MGDIGPRKIAPLCFPWEVYRIGPNGRPLFQDEFQTKAAAERYIKGLSGQDKFVVAHYTNRPRNWDAPHG